MALQPVFDSHAIDYCRYITDDMEFNKKQFNGKVPIGLWVDSDHAIPKHGRSPATLFQQCHTDGDWRSGRLVRE